MYQTEIDGTHHELGTSGYLYRSNKLMYDQGTLSLWSTLSGEPVVGKLVGQGLRLEPLYCVTTTWKQWRDDHPETTVCSLETGYRRNYDEGFAYKDYFGDDKLMFPVPEKDDRLKNKDEVLIIRAGELGKTPLAIAAKFLEQTPIYADEVNGQKVVVFTDTTGANRAFESRDLEFSEFDGKTAQDQNGTIWTLTEKGMTSEGNESLERLPAHRVFWFGWHAQYPETRLVQ